MAPIKISGIVVGLTLETIITVLQAMHCQYSNPREYGRIQLRVATRFNEE